MVLAHDLDMGINARYSKNDTCGGFNMGYDPFSYSNLVVITNSHVVYIGTINVTPLLRQFLALEGFCHSILWISIVSRYSLT